MFINSQKVQRTKAIDIVNDLQQVLCGSTSKATSKDTLDQQKPFPKTDSTLSRYCDGE